MSKGSHVVRDLRAHVYVATCANLNFNALYSSILAI